MTNEWWMENVNVTIWHDAAGRKYRNYECKLCRKKTIFPHLMKEHQATNNHLWPYPAADDNVGDISSEPIDPRYK